MEFSVSAPASARFPQAEVRVEDVAGTAVAILAPVEVVADIEAEAWGEGQNQAEIRADADQAAAPKKTSPEV